MGYLPAGINSQNRSMDLYDIRRERLREVMRRDHGDSQVALANALEIAPTYVSRMFSLPGKKGHKRISGDFARQMEQKLYLARGYLDGEIVPQQIAEMKATPVMDFSPEAWQFAQQWNKLDGPEKAGIHGYVLWLVGEQERDKRKPKAARAAPSVSVTTSSHKPSQPPKPAVSGRKKDPHH